VFLSYASQDADAALRICESLRAAGIDWYQKAFADRSPDMVYANVGSRLNPRLAANAGFRGILDQMAFPSPASQTN
jgi:hypothetical protein